MALLNKPPSPSKDAPISYVLSDALIESTTLLFCCKTIFSETDILSVKLEVKEKTGISDNVKLSAKLFKPTLNAGMSEALAESAKGRATVNVGESVGVALSESDVPTVNAGESVTVAESDKLLKPNVIAGASDITTGSGSTAAVERLVSIGLTTVEAN